MVLSLVGSIWILSLTVLIGQSLNTHIMSGIGMMLAMATGIMLGQCQTFVRSSLWWALAILAAPAILVLPPNIAMYAFLSL